MSSLVHSAPPGCDHRVTRFGAFGLSVTAERIFPHLLDLDLARLAERCKVCQVRRQPSQQVGCVIGPLSAGGTQSNPLFIHFVAFTRQGVDAAIHLSL